MFAALDTRLREWLCDAHGRVRRRRMAAALAGFYVLFSVTYLPINEFSVGRRAYILYLPGEERLPFLPVFEYLYVLAYFLPLLLIARIRDYKQFRRLGRAILLTLLVAYSTYLAFPVYLERPHLEVTSFHTWLLSLQYLDKSYNHLPSLHVAFSWLVVLSAQVSRRSRIALGLLATGIGISTLFVKQHYIVDVLYGCALACITWWLARDRRSVDASNGRSPAIGRETATAAE